MGPFTVFDVETTGMSPVRDRIVEIGAVRVDRDGVWTRFETLVNPGMPIPYQVTRVHGIDDRMVADAPSFSDAAYRFLDFARGSKLVAQIRKAYPGLSSYSLQFLRQALGLGQEIDEARPHRAGYDAELTMEAFSMAMKTLHARAGE